MIQRLQSVYLLLVLAAMITLSLGVTVFENTTQKKGSFVLTTTANVYGVQEGLKVNGELAIEDKDVLRQTLDIVNIENGVENVPTFYFPFYSITILLSMFTLVVLMGYKKLERQLKLGRVLFIVNFLAFGVVLLLYYQLMGSNGFEDKEWVEIHHGLGLGFYCIVFALAFSFLANTGIKRDLKLIKSIDRIR